MYKINTKICFACKEEKLVIDFYADKSRATPYQRECKECTRKRRKEWWTSEVGRRSSANTKLQSRFGISLDEYEEMLKAVKGKCEICGASSSHGGHRLAVDHNHKTGDIRGLLCKACNVGLGNFKDNIDALKKAIEYLQRNKH